MERRLFSHPNTSCNVRSRDVIPGTSKLHLHGPRSPPICPLPLQSISAVSPAGDSDRRCVRWCCRGAIRMDTGIGFFITPTRIWTSRTHGASTYYSVNSPPRQRTTAYEKTKVTRFSLLGGILLALGQRYIRTSLKTVTALTRYRLCFFLFGQKRRNVVSPHFV